MGLIEMQDDPSNLLMVFQICLMALKNPCLLPTIAQKVQRSGLQYLGMLVEEWERSIKREFSMRTADDIRKSSLSFHYIPVFTAGSVHVVTFLTHYTASTFIEL
jgi:hypothetical protein